MKRSMLRMPSEHCQAAMKDSESGRAVYICGNAIDKGPNSALVSGRWPDIIENIGF
jgi:hypothetical protein